MRNRGRTCLNNWPHFAHAFDDEPLFALGSIVIEYFWPEFCCCADGGPTAFADGIAKDSIKI